MLNEEGSPFTPGEVLNDKAQNKRCVFVQDSNQTYSENTKANGNARNEHYVDDPDETLCQVVYLPDEGEMTSPTSIYNLPVSRLERFRVEDAYPGIGELEPIADAQAQTIATTVIALADDVAVENVTRESIDSILGEEIGEVAWDYLELVKSAAEDYDG